MSLLIFSLTGSSSSRVSRTGQCWNARAEAKRYSKGYHGDRIVSDIRARCGEHDSGSRTWRSDEKMGHRLRGPLRAICVGKPRSERVNAIGKATEVPNVPNFATYRLRGLPILGQHQHPSMWEQFAVSNLFREALAIMLYTQHADTDHHTDDSP